MEDDLQWKMTSNGKRPPMEDYLKYQKSNISAATGGKVPKFETISATTRKIFPKFSTQAYVTKANFTNVSHEDDLQWKTISNFKREISKQLLVVSSPNSKLKL